MPYILDVALLLIVAIAVFLGYRRGFVRSVLQFFGCALACALAIWLSGIASQVVFDHALRDGIHQTVAQAFEQTVADGATASLTEQSQRVHAALPSFLQNAVTSERLTEGIREAVGNEQTTAQVADYVTDSLVRPVVIGVLRLLLFLILFIVSLLLIRLLRKWIKPITRLPFIRQADGWLGAVFGLLQGAVFAYVAVIVIQLLIVGVPSFPITAQDLDTSLIAGGIASWDPLTEVINF